jgi:hypothetical protein
LQRGGGAAVEDVAFDFGAIFAGEGDVAAVVEGFFQGDADFFVGGELRRVRVRARRDWRAGLIQQIRDRGGRILCLSFLKLRSKPESKS